MVDILQVLEGATYMAFIAGAIFAVLELRSMNKDRETDFMMRLNEYWTSKDFIETVVKVRELPETNDPREIEDLVGKMALHSYVEYLDGIGQMGRNKTMRLDFVLDLAEWAGLWVKLEPWILDVRQKGIPLFGSDFQWIVEEDQLWIVRNIPRAELDS